MSSIVEVVPAQKDNNHNQKSIGVNTRGSLLNSNNQGKERIVNTSVRTERTVYETDSVLLQIQI